MYSVLIYWYSRRRVHSLNISECSLKYWDYAFERLSIISIQKLRGSQMKICYFCFWSIAAFSYTWCTFYSIRFTESFQSFSGPSIFVYTFNFSLLFLKFQYHVNNRYRNQNIIKYARLTFKNISMVHKKIYHSQIFFFNYFLLSF